MSEHLSARTLSALADGELSAEELAGVEAHLAECAACTRRALEESLLKRAVSRTGQRYAMPAGFEERMRGAIAEERASLQYRDSGHVPRAVQNDDRRAGLSKLVWVGALAAVVLVGVSVLVVRRVSTENTALVAEAVDEHIAALAAGSAPEVVSSDRHTVKPWFQGRLPFSFNLPQALAADTTLDGANLTYVQGEPAAQLLFSIGKHRVSMFVRQRGNAESGLGTSLHDPSASSGQVVGRPLLSDHNGFHVEEIRTTELDMVAVSDVDASRLRELMQAMEAVQ